MSKKDNRIITPTSWGFFWLKVLYSLPIIGFIMLIVHSFDSYNIPKRNHARSYWCALLALLILSAVIAGIIVALGFDIQSMIDEVSHATR